MRTRISALKVGTVVLGVLGIIVFLLGVAQTPNFVKIRSIECVSQYGPCSKEVTESLNTFVGRPFPEAVNGVGEYFDSNASHQASRTYFKLPNRLVVSVLERKPAYAVKIKNQNLFALVDLDGLVLRYVEKTALPHIEVATKPDVLERLQAGDLFALQLISQIQKSYEISQVSKYEDRVEMTIDGYKVLLPIAGEAEIVLGALYTIFNQLNNPEFASIIGDRNLNVVDLRYKNPVLR